MVYIVVGIMLEELLLLFCCGCCFCFCLDFVCDVFFRVFGYVRVLGFGLIIVLWRFIIVYVWNWFLFVVF